MKRETKQVFFILIIAFVLAPIMFIGLLLGGLYLKHFNDTYTYVIENTDDSGAFPFAKNVFYFREGRNEYGEGNTSWDAIKNYSGYKKLHWIPIDQNEGIEVTCYKFSSQIHPSQEQDFKTSRMHMYRGPHYDHTIFKGYYHIEKTEKTEKIIVFDSDNNRFFYHFDVRY